MKRKHRFLTIFIVIIFIVILAVLYLSFCAFVKKYPSKWGKLIPIEKNECADISGTYLALGEMGLKDTINLSFLLPLELRNIYATHVQIKQEDDTLEITVFEKQELLRRKLYLKRDGEYYCTPDGIKLSYEDGRCGEVFECLSYDVDIYLRKSTDGALIINEKRVTSGVFLFFPVMSRESYWFRFKQKSL